MQMQDLKCLEWLLCSITQPGTHMHGFFHDACLYHTSSICIPMKQCSRKWHYKPLHPDSWSKCHPKPLVWFIFTNTRCHPIFYHAFVTVLPLVHGFKPASLSSFHLVHKVSSGLFCSWHVLYLVWSWSFHNCKLILAHVLGCPLPYDILLILSKLTQQSIVWFHFSSRLALIHLLAPNHHTLHFFQTE